MGKLDGLTTCVNKITIGGNIVKSTENTGEDRLIVYTDTLTRTPATGDTIDELHICNQATISKITFGVVGCTSCKIKTITKSDKIGTLKVTCYYCGTTDYNAIDIAANHKKSSTPLIF